MRYIRKNLCEYCEKDWKTYLIKKKELEVKHFLTQNEFNFLSHDKKIQGSTLLNRPDFLFLSNNKNYYVVLEVDEYQHEFYKETCECIRMVNISQELKKPTIFIRYNPDSFRFEGKNKNISCFKRQKVLKVWLQNALNKSEEDIKNYGYLSFVKLFYDDFKEENCNYVTVINWDN